MSLTFALGCLKAEAQFSFFSLNNPAKGAFVMTNSTYSGSMGGVAGANGKCVTDLTNSNWRGKANFTSTQINSAKAFLCSGTSCNNLAANVAYEFAKATPAPNSIGGEAFLTDSNGRGPNDAANWSEESRFGGNYSWWSGRADGTSNLWPTSGDSGSPCMGWTATGLLIFGYSGGAGKTDAINKERWSQAGDSDCSDSKNLICFINP